MRRLALSRHPMSRNLVALAALAGLLLPVSCLAETLPAGAGQAPVDQPASDPTAANPSAAEQPPTDQPASDQPAAEQPAAQPAPTPVAPSSGRETFSSTISEVDACNQAQTLTPENATVTAMHVSTALNGEYATFTCRVNWSLSPSAQPTYRPILFSPSS